MAHTVSRLHSQKLRPYKGVTFYKRTGRWEANLWYENQQHFLGASYTALEAARAYDKAILFTRSSTEQLNFDRSDYTDDIQEMRGMSFIKCRQYLRDISRVPNCEVVNRLYKGILIDQSGTWEVKYLAKNQGRPNAYNEAASRYDGPRAVIQSFQRSQVDTTLRSLRDTTSRSDVLMHRIDMEGVSDQTRGEEPVLSDDPSTSTFNPGSQEQLPDLTETRAPVSREEIHEDGVNIELLVLGSEPLSRPETVQEVQNEVLIHDRPVPNAEEAPSTLCFVELVASGTEMEILTRGRDPQLQDLIQLLERRGEHHTDASGYWIVKHYAYHGQSGGVVYHGIHNFFHVHSQRLQCAPALNGGVVTTATRAIDLGHLKTEPPFYVDISLSQSINA